MTMIHPHTELRFISDDIGYGVFATRPIPFGTVTWVGDALDRTFPVSAIARMTQPIRDTLDHYCYRNRKGDYVLCWDHARFTNHSFRPNCMATAYDFEIAVRDIAAGEELTNDYGFLNIAEPFRARDEGDRRKVVYPDDLKRYHRRWDRMLKTAFRRFLSVEQPLRPFFKESSWRKAVRVADGRTAMDSILGNLFCG
jgi:hypothetical protein